MLQGWKTYKLGDLIKVNSNSIRKEQLEWLNYIDIKSVGSGFYENPKRLEFKNAPSRARRLLSEGDTVISSVRPNLKSFFYAKNLPENTVASTGFAVLTPKNIHPRFLYYLTTNDNYIDYLVRSCTGSAYPAFGPNVISQSIVSIPEFEEQKSIASILSALDDKIENNLAMNKTLEDMAMALYKHWFVDFGPFQEGEFVDSELGMIPKGWAVKSLKEICLKIYSGGTPRTGNPDYWGGEIPWLSSGETNQKFIISTEKFITEFGLKKSSAKMANKWDTVIASAGQGKTRGQTSYLFLDTSINQSVIVLKANISYVYPQILFLDLASRYNEFRMISDSYSTRGSLTTKLIGSQIYLPLPEIQVQDSFKNKVTSMFNQIESNLKENQTLSILRDTLLPKLISGEVRVKDVEKTIAEAL